MRDDVAKAFALPPERVRVIAPYVGGGFGSKGFTHAHVILTVMAAQVARRPAKLALTRQQMFSLVGYRPPTIQRIRLGAGRDGQLTAIAHDVVVHTATIHEYTEPTALPTRMMYAAPHRYRRRCKVGSCPKEVPRNVGGDDTTREHIGQHSVCQHGGVCVCVMLPSSQPFFRTGVLFRLRP
jgi:hypothetical protein